MHRLLLAVLFALISSGVHAKNHLYNLPLDDLTVNGRYQIPSGRAGVQAVAINIKDVGIEPPNLELLRASEENFVLTSKAALEKSFRNYGYNTDTASGHDVANLKYNIDGINISTPDEEQPNIIRVSLQYSATFHAETLHCEEVSNTIEFDLHNSRKLSGFGSFGNAVTGLFFRNDQMITRRVRPTLAEQEGGLEAAWEGQGEGTGNFKRDELAARYAVIKAIQLSFVNLIYKYNTQDVCTVKPLGGE